MNTQLLLGAMVLVLIGLVGLLVFLKRRKSAPVTSASIPPIPSTQEANKHFTPANTMVAAQKKPGVNKKLLIFLAVIFNIILIGAVIFIGQSATQQSQTMDSQAQPTTITINPTDVVDPPPTSVPVEDPTPTCNPIDQNCGGISPTVKPTCTPMPLCVQQNICDIPEPQGGWCPTSPTSRVIIITPTPTSAVARTITTTRIPSGSAAGNVTTLPDAGNPAPLLMLIVPALLVAIAFIL